MFLPKSLASSLESQLAAIQCPSFGPIWKLQGLTAYSLLRTQRDAAYAGMRP